MMNKVIPIINGYWYFNKTSFNVTNGCIRFTMYTKTRTWRHVNSEGWEKYHNEMDLNCILQFETIDGMYLEVSSIYKRLSEKEEWTTAELNEFLNNYKYQDFSIHEEKEIMDDCY